MSVAVFFIGYVSGYQAAIRPQCSLNRSPGIQCLDVVVPPVPKKAPEEGLRKVPRWQREDIPEYQKSNRNMYPRKCDVMDEIEDFVQEQIDAGVLLHHDTAWQPHDFLPDSEKPTEEWIDEVRELRETAAEIPDDLLLVLIGDMVRSPVFCSTTYTPICLLNRYGIGLVNSLQ